MTTSNAHVYTDHRAAAVCRREPSCGMGSIPPAKKARPLLGMKWPEDAQKHPEPGGRSCGSSTYPLSPCLGNYGGNGSRGRPRGRRSPGGRRPSPEPSSPQPLPTHSAPPEAARPSPPPAADAAPTSPGAPSRCRAALPTPPSSPAPPRRPRRPRGSPRAPPRAPGAPVVPRRRRRRVPYRAAAPGGSRAPRRAGHFFLGNFSRVCRAEPAGQEKRSAPGGCDHPGTSRRCKPSPSAPRPPPPPRPCGPATCGRAARPPPALRPLLPAPRPPRLSACEALRPAASGPPEPRGESAERGGRGSWVPPCPPLRGEARGRGVQDERLQTSGIWTVCTPEGPSPDAASSAACRRWGASSPHPRESLSPSLSPFFSRGGRALRHLKVKIHLKNELQDGVEPPEAHVHVRLSPPSTVWGQRGRPSRGEMPFLPTKRAGFFE